MYCQEENSPIPRRQAVTLTQETEALFPHAVPLGGTRIEPVEKLRGQLVGRKQR